MKDLLKLIAASVAILILLPSTSFAINNVSAGAISILSKNCTACHYARVNPKKGMPCILK